MTWRDRVGVNFRDVAEQGGTRGANPKNIFAEAAQRRPRRASAKNEFKFANFGHGFDDHLTALLRSGFAHKSCLTAKHCIETSTALFHSHQEEKVGYHLQQIQHTVIF
jgi:hypothetical protein